MSPELAKRVDRIISVWNGADPNIILEEVADNFTYHHFSLPEPLRGRQAFLEFIHNLRAAFPDFRVTPDEVFAEDNKVVIKWSWTGTHQGEWRGIAPTGKRVSQQGISITHLENGKFAEEFCVADALALLRQLDAIPAGVKL